jgi:hypothetical protein
MYKLISFVVVAALGTLVGGSIPSAPTFPKIVAKVALTNQTGSIPATTLVTPTASALYRISVYMVQVFPQTSTCGGNCGQVMANFQWTDDGGTQVMGQGNSAIYSPFNLQLLPASGDGNNSSCAQSHGGTCVPFLFGWPAGLPGGTFLVRANAGTPLIYSVTLFGEDGGTSMLYDYFMTVEQLE